MEDTHSTSSQALLDGSNGEEQTFEEETVAFPVWAQKKVPSARR